MPHPDGGVCATCVWWEFDYETASVRLGQCRVRAPNSVCDEPSIPNASRIVLVMTHAGYWCGEWEGSCAIDTKRAISKELDKLGI